MFCKKNFNVPRKTVIKDEITEIVIDELAMVDRSDFVVIISKNGYIKKVSVRSYNSTDELNLREEDYVENIYKINNLDTLLLFTNLGNYLYVPVRDIPESKNKDLKDHISSFVSISDGEKIIRSYGVRNFDDSVLTLITKNGVIKNTLLKSYKVTRYSRPLSAISLKSGDELVNVSVKDGSEYIIVTKRGMCLKFNSSEIPVLGLKASGVKGINLNDGDYVINGQNIYDDEHLAIFTDNKTAKRVKLSDIQKFTRAKKGTSIIKSPKSKTYLVMNAYLSDSKTVFGLLNGNIENIKASEISIMDKSSTGSNITKKSVSEALVVNKLKDITKRDAPDKIESEEREKIIEPLTMSDFFDEFKI